MKLATAGILSALQAADSGGGVLPFADNFTRSNRSLNGDNGWAVYIGGTWNITSDVLTTDASTDGAQLIRSGRNAVVVAANLVCPATDLQDFGIVAHWVDDLNYIAADFSNNGIAGYVRIIKVAAGSGGVVTSAAYDYRAATHVLELDVSNPDTAIVRVDGVQMLSADVSTQPQGTGVGFRHGATGAGTITCTEFNAYV